MRGFDSWQAGTVCVAYGGCHVVVPPLLVPERLVEGRGSSILAALEMNCELVC